MSSIYLLINKRREYSQSLLIPRFLSGVSNLSHDSVPLIYYIPIIIFQYETRFSKHKSRSFKWLHVNVTINLQFPCVKGKTFLLVAKIVMERILSSENIDSSCDSSKCLRFFVFKLVSVISPTDMYKSRIHDPLSRSYCLNNISAQTSHLSQKSFKIF